MGRDVKSGQTLAGFGGYARPGFSVTDMVRIKSLADETRMLVAVVMSGESEVQDYGVTDDADELAAQRIRDAESPKPRCNAVEYNPSVKEEDGDDDNADFIDVPAPTAPSGPGKRKGAPESADPASPTTADEMNRDAAADADGNDLHSEMKRIKVEDADAEPFMEEQPSPRRTSPPLPPPAPDKRRAAMTDDEPMQQYGDSETQGGSAPSGKFQWSIDDDDEDSTDSDTESKPVPAPPRETAQPTAATATAAAATPSSPSFSITTTKPQQWSPPVRVNGGDLYGTGDNDEEEEEDDDDEDRRGDSDSDNDDEEELHLNVARVYDKTLTRLGRTLGGSLVDD